MITKSVLVSNGFFLEIIWDTCSRSNCDHPQSYRYAEWYERSFRMLAVVAGMVKDLVDRTHLVFGSPHPSCKRRCRSSIPSCLATQMLCTIPVPIFARYVTPRYEKQIAKFRRVDRWCVHFLSCRSTRWLRCSVRRGLDVSATSYLDAAGHELSGNVDGRRLF